MSLVSEYFYGSRVADFEPTFTLVWTAWALVVNRENVNIISLPYVSDRQFLWLNAPLNAVVCKALKDAR